MNQWNEPSQPINKCNYIKQFDLELSKYLLNMASFIFVAKVFIKRNMQFTPQTRPCRVYWRAMAGSIEGQRQVQGPMRVNFFVPRLPWSHCYCKECKNIANFLCEENLPPPMRNEKFISKWSNFVNFWARTMCFFLNGSEFH